jgi:hypothetical protein
MENADRPIWKNTMNYGAILGLALIIYSLILYFAGLTASKLLAYLSYLLLIAGIYFATKHYRDKILGGFISYGKAMAAGVLTSLFASIILAFFTYVQLRFIDPQIIEKQITLTGEQMVHSGLPEKQVEMTVQLMKKFMTPLAMALWGIIGFAFIGTIISVITSAILNNDEGSFKTKVTGIEKD